MTSKSLYLRSTLCKATAAVDWDPSDGSGQSQSKTFWEGFTIPDAIEDVGDSEGFRTSVEELAAHAVGTARELELEA